MKKFIKVNFIILVIFSLIAIKSFAEDSENVEQLDEQVVENDSRIDELEKQKQDLEQQTQEYNSQLEFINEELTATVVEISELTQSMYEKQTEIEELKAKSEQLVAEIEETENELSKATENYEAQKELLEKRLVAMYEMGDTSYLDLLLSSKGISSFLSNYFYISEIATTDTELLQIVTEQKENVENLMTTLQESQSALNATKSDLEKATIALSNMVIIKNQRLQNLSEEELALQKEVEEYQSQIQEVEAEIRLLSLSSNNAEYVGGTFLWPVPGYTRVSSAFGMRTHPITGVYKLHTGTDISAPYGATFVAANDGLVTKADFNTAYGNMVVIDHGGGISTLYAHGSEILVQVGDTIKQGTPVLKVGSTGYSTGPHAHFEIRIDGTYVDPLDYLSQEVTLEQNAETETVEINTEE